MQLSNFYFFLMLAFGDSVPSSFDTVHDIVSLFGKVQPFCTGAADTPPTSPRSPHEENVSGHNDTEEIAMLLYTAITSYIAVVRGKPLNNLFCARGCIPACTAQGGVSKHAHGRGVYLPGGWCTCPVGVCVSQHAMGQTPPPFWTDRHL